MTQENLDDTTIRHYGWSQAWERLYRNAGLPGLPARVVRQERGLYSVLGGEEECPAEISGRFRHEAKQAATYPAVGDWVVAEFPPRSLAVIHAVLPRRSALSRIAPGTRGEEQILAANVDAVFILVGMDGDYNLRRLERYITLVWDSGAMPVVLLNKADLMEDAADFVAQAGRVAAGAPVHAISAARGTGLEPLAEYLVPGRTLAVVGSSGAGKSTLANQLLGTRVQETREVREDDSRGRHTTTRRELFLLPGGALLIDTPGLRELQLSSSSSALDTAFEDVVALGEACRFRDCRHQEDPGCAVQAAVREGRLSASRLAGYQKLQREIAYQERRGDIRAQQEEQARWKHIHKEIRRMNKAREQGER